jgi:two-component system, response regulator
MNNEVEIQLVEDNPNEESDMIETYRLGINSYIVKPFDFDKFIEFVKNIGFYWLLVNKQPDIKKLIK